MFKSNSFSLVLYFQKSIPQTKHIKQNLAFPLKVALKHFAETMRPFFSIQNLWITLLHQSQSNFSSILYNLEHERAHPSVYELICSKFDAKEFWMFVCDLLVLKCWNLCIRVCIQCNRGAGLPFQVKFTKISYLPPLLSYHLSILPLKLRETHLRNTADNIQEIQHILSPHIPFHTTFPSCS